MWLLTRLILTSEVSSKKKKKKVIPWYNILLEIRLAEWFLKISNACTERTMNIILVCASSIKCVCFAHNNGISRLSPLMSKYRLRWYSDKIFAYHSWGLGFESWLGHGCVCQLFSMKNNPSAQVSQLRESVDLFLWRDIFFLIIRDVRMNRQCFNKSQLN